MAKKILSIVETAYRGTLEEQDDTVLWLTHMLQNNGLDQTIVLAGNAVNYAVRGQDASGLRFGDSVLAHAPEIDRDLEKLMEKGVPVYYVSDDATARGIPTDRLIEGVKPIARRELPSLMGGYEQVWAW
jgi:sulfur transfer complex TusBCD TusB component (DsrH family)